MATMIRRKWLRKAVRLSVLLALPALCHAQNRARSHRKAKPKTPAEIRVVSRLVTVSVVVHCKHGNPVDGLSQKDFTILDDGHPQTISFFRAPSAAPASASSRPLPPDVYSNMNQSAGGPSAGLTILLLDNLNSGFLSQDTARSAVTRFLQRIPPKQRISLYVLGKRLIVIHDFSSHPAALLAALKQAGSGIRYESTPPAPVAPSPFGYPGSVELNQNIAQTNEITAGYGKDLRLDGTLRALDQIAAHVAGVPGRKNLVWVTARLPFCLCAADRNLDPSYLGKIHRLESLLSSDNVSVYPVDTRGLLSVDSTVTRTLDSTGSANSKYFAENDIASTTGGVAFYGSNGFQSAMQRAVSDADSSYLLGYYPEHGDWKGEFRTIAVKVDRPGLKVRARSGYYATPPKPAGSATLARLALSPLDSTGIHLRVQVLPLPAKSKPQVRLIVVFDPNGIRFTPRANREVAHLEVGIYQKDAKGRILEGGQKTIRLAAAAATFAKAEKQGMRMQFKFPLSAKVSTLVLVLCDPRTGISGSVPIPVRNYLSRSRH